jgi:hypothetical protein
MVFGISQRLAVECGILRLGDFYFPRAISINLSNVRDPSDDPLAVVLVSPSKLLGDI